MTVQRIVLSATLAVALSALGLRAQAPAQTGFKRTIVQQSDLPSVPGREVVQAIVEVQPGAESGRHTHPGEEIMYVLEGTIQLEIQGKPAVAKKAGDAHTLPPGIVHNAKNTAGSVAKVLGTYIIEKGKAVATPVQ